MFIKPLTPDELIRYLLELNKVDYARCCTKLTLPQLQDRGIISPQGEGENTSYTWGQNCKKCMAIGLRVDLLRFDDGVILYGEVINGSNSKLDGICHSYFSSMT